MFCWVLKEAIWEEAVRNRNPEQIGNFRFFKKGFEFKTLDFRYCLKCSISYLEFNQVGLDYEAS